MLSYVNRCVTAEMNRDLCVTFTGEEVWAALSEMGDLKAPGADGYPAIFYKKFWWGIGSRLRCSQS